MPEDIAPLSPPPSFEEDASALGIAFDPGDVERLGTFLALLIEANTRFNLTRITDPDDAWAGHVLDSLTLVPLLASLEARSVIDIGSGGGPPGLVLAIVSPDTQFTLLEATGKKATFLEETAARLGLQNVRVVADRAENAGRDRATHREQYDVVTARAVGPMPVLAELTIPFAKVSGHILAIKGSRAPEEIDRAKEALYRLHSRVIETRPTPRGTIVVIEKDRRTPKIYPRRPGEPKRIPLGGAAARESE